MKIFKKILKIAAIILGVICALILLTVFIVKTFVFKDYNGRPTTGEYEIAEVQAILTDNSRVETFENDGSNREVPVHFYYPENIDELGEGTLPLVIFSHGAFGYYQSNTSTYQELASNGYVVASLDHPYHSFFTKDTKGKIVTVNTGFFQTALNIGNSDLPETETYPITSEWVKLRIDDMNFVIDTLKDAGAKKAPTDCWFYDKNDENEILSVLSATDFDKIGLMGHSLGGATAVTVGRRDDISAVIDLDGTMLGEEMGVENGAVKINEEPYTTPLLSIENEEHHNAAKEAVENSYAYANNVVLSNAECGYETYFKGAGHMNFTDLPLIAPALADMLGTGSVDKEECIDTMNALVRSFYDCYLKGAAEFTVKESY